MLSQDVKLKCCIYLVEESNELHWIVWVRGWVEEVGDIYSHSIKMISSINVWHVLCVGSYYSYHHPSHCHHLHVAFFLMPYQSNGSTIRCLELGKKIFYIAAQKVKFLFSLFSPSFSLSSSFRIWICMKLFPHSNNSKTLHLWLSPLSSREHYC